MFFQIFNIPIIDFPIGVLDFALIDQVIILPLSCDHFPRWKNQGALAIELVAQAVADVLVAVQKLKMSLDFDAVLVGAFENDAIAVDDLGFSLELVVLPDAVYFIAIPVGFGQFLGGPVGGRHA